MHHLHCIFIVWPTKACDYKPSDVIKPSCQKTATPCSICKCTWHVKQLSRKRQKKNKLILQSLQETSCTLEHCLESQLKDRPQNLAKLIQRKSRNTKYVKLLHSIFMPFPHALHTQCPGFHPFQMASSETHPATCHLINSNKTNQLFMPKSPTNCDCI